MKFFKLKNENRKLKIPAEHSGMTLFISVIIMSILLFISFAVINIAIKGTLFASSGRNSQYAFYAADAGLECALYWDSFDPSKFDGSISGSPISCGGNVIANGQAIPGGTVTQIGGGGGSPVNYALPANGGSVSVSSTYSAGFPASSAINGDRTGAGWGSGTGGWNDGTSNTYPDWLQVNFSGAKNISEIDVFTLADGSPVTPTISTTANVSGIIDFQVQYDNGSGWVTVPGGNVTGNNLAWRKFQFSTISNVTKVRVLVSNSRDGGGGWWYSRIVELEAWGTESGASGSSLFYFDMNNGLNPVPYCAIVGVTKNGDGTVHIESRGYNTCDTSNPRRVERGIEVTY